ncbi:Cysteine--tRNA ligase [compost metagenome]
MHVLKVGAADGSAADRARLAASLDLLGFRRGLKALMPELQADETLINERIAARLDARRAKNFAESDRIRDELAAMGITLKDGKDPTTGESTTTWEVKR